MIERGPFLPLWGRGTIRRMVEGHVPHARAMTNVPLHQLRWSPSPFRGGTA